MVDTETNNALNEMYEVVARSGSTKLRAATKLSSLLAFEDEREHRKRQKYENLLEEMRSVSVCVCVCVCVCDV